MTRHIPDDIRYMSHEVRVAEGYMKPLDRDRPRKVTKADWERAVAAYVEMGEARKRGRAAVHGSVEYETAVADFAFWAGKVAEARARGVKI